MVRHGPLVMTLGSTSPIVAVNFDPTPGPDSGFLVVFSDGPPPDVDWDSEIGWLCLHCLIDENPEVGAALDLARTIGGEVRPDGAGGWVAFDELEGES